MAFYSLASILDYASPVTEMAVYRPQCAFSWRGSPSSIDHGGQQKTSFGAISQVFASATISGFTSRVWHVLCSPPEEVTPNDAAAFS
jgi:hypothetical protein